MKNRLTLLFTVLALAAQAQSSLTLNRSLIWAEKPNIHTFSDGDAIEVWRFEQCSFSDETPTLPIFSERIALPGRAKITVEVQGAQYEAFAKKPSPDDAVLGKDLVINTFVEQERGKYWGRIRFVPVRKTGSGFERLTSFTLNVRILPEPVSGATDRGGPFTTASALRDGSLFKFGVANSGVYKLDYAFLKSQLGISNLDDIDPRTIHLYGNGGAMLPERNSDPRPDDLIENAIQIVGEEDGKFNTGDFILFYAVGPEPWFYRPAPADPQLTVRKNLYDRNAWYFIKTGAGNGLRLSEQVSVPASYTTEEFDDYRHLEDEKVNLLDFAPSAQGSGKRWFGDYFYQTRERTYDFNFPNLVAGSAGRVRAEFAGRSGVTSAVRLTIGATVINKSIGLVSVSNNEAVFASNAVLNGAFNPTGDQVNVKIEYPNVSLQSEGWIDYIELNVRRKLTMSGQFMEFRDLQTLSQDAAIFRLSGLSGSHTVWDITNPQVPARQQVTSSGAALEFGAATKDQLRSFIVFADNAAFPKPEVALQGSLSNQNLHGLDNIDMVIVYHSALESQAKQLAEHRHTFSGLRVETVNVDQVYNEFSSGGKEPTAIRDFTRMLYERNPVKFKYLLLFGDGSFDPKNNSAGNGNTDFIPVYETAESFSPITAYPSDDYFALLSPEEGATIKGGLLDVAAGRITAGSSDEAQAIVDKIIDYDKNPATLGDWHLRAMYAADDEDGNPHINQADKLATENAAAEKWFNIEKVYFDAYQQISSSGSARIPDAKAAINSNVFKGMLVLQYIGHGGPRGWAQERVVDNNDIAGWDNPNRYPLIVTATCSFGGYDDYTTLTGGEQVLAKVKSGAVALFTTVRAVYIDANERLTDAVQEVIFQRVDGKYRTIGDILKAAKNSPSVNGEDNARRFTLLGDPAMYLALPEYRVATTKINGKAVVAGTPDTLKALMPVNIEGIVTDTLGNLLNDYNGKVYVTIFDKAQTLQTLGQDAGSYVRSFTVQRNVIFKGSATVTSGQFKIDFIVPKDINYAFDSGKISYYAENGTPLDAAGADKNIIVGGNANLIHDDQPPVVLPYLNTDAFVIGGITNNDPKILVKCSDDYGMNVSGTSLGHDLVAILDDNVLETIVLNDFYESAQDNYRQGQAIYPLRNIAPGRHKLRVKGWDIANNPGEGYTEFIVAEDGKAALGHVLNYPNPFTTNTNFQFEHNLAGQVLDVQINIFTVSGKMVKSIFHTASPDGFRVTDIPWDGRDEYGDPLARGVYLYRIKVRGTDIGGGSVTAESEFEKVVLLK